MDYRIYYLESMEDAEMTEFVDKNPFITIILIFVVGELLSRILEILGKWAGK